MARSKPPILVRCGGQDRIRKALLAERGCAGGPGGSLWCDCTTVERVLKLQGCDTGCLCARKGATHVEVKISGNQTMATHFNGSDIIAIGGGACQGGNCKGANIMRSGTRVQSQSGKRWLDEEDEDEKRRDRMNKNTRGVEDDDTAEDDEDEEFDFGLDDLDDDSEADPTATPDIESIDAATADASPSQQTATLIGQLALSVGRLMDQLKKPQTTKAWTGWQYGHAKERAFYQALVRRLESAPHARVALAFARRLVGF